MNFEKGSEVIVKSHSGTFVKALVDDYVFESGSYWVNANGTFMLFSIQDLENWNGDCVCGSDTVGHPGHTYYCNKRHLG
jgi:hypothetical protein